MLAGMRTDDLCGRCLNPAVGIFVEYADSGAAVISGNEDGCHVPECLSVKSELGMKPDSECYVSRTQRTFVIVSLLQWIG